MDPLSTLSGDRVTQQGPGQGPEGEYGGVKDDWVEDLFGAEEEQRFYPGSKRPIERARPTAPEPDDDAWDAHPQVYVVGGVQTEFFTIGALAAALGKSANTVREWERFGWIPLARYRTKAVSATKAKRLYTRAQVEGIVHIAREEGLMVPKPRDIPKSQFTPRVVELFQRLEAEG